MDEIEIITLLERKTEAELLNYVLDILSRPKVMDRQDIAELAFITSEFDRRDRVKAGASILKTHCGL